MPFVRLRPLALVSRTPTCEQGYGMVGSAAVVCFSTQLTTLVAQNRVAFVSVRRGHRVALLLQQRSASRIPSVLQMEPLIQQVLEATARSQGVLSPYNPATPSS